MAKLKINLYKHKNFTNKGRMFSNLLKNNNPIIYLGLYMVFLNLVVTPANAEIYSKDGTYYWRYSIEQQIPPHNAISIEAIEGYPSYFMDYWIADPGTTLSFKGRLKWFVHPMFCGKNETYPCIEEKFSGVSYAEFVIAKHITYKGNVFYEPYERLSVKTDNNGYYSVKIKLPETRPEEAENTVRFTFWHKVVMYKGINYELESDLEKPNSHASQAEIRTDLIFNDLGVKLEYENEYYAQVGKSIDITGKAYFKGGLKSKPLSQIKIRLEIDTNFRAEIQADKDGNFSYSLSQFTLPGYYKIKLTPYFNDIVGVPLNRLIIVDKTKRPIVSRPSYTDDNKSFDKFYAKSFKF